MNFQKVIPYSTCRRQVAHQCLAQLLFNMEPMELYACHGSETFQRLLLRLQFGNQILWKFLMLVPIKEGWGFLKFDFTTVVDFFLHFSQQQIRSNISFI